MKASDNQFPKLILTEGAAPPTPDAGTVKVYAKTDGAVYAMDDTGAETPLGGGGGGGIPDAPIDGSTYGRKDGVWVVVPGGGGYSPSIFSPDKAGGTLASQKKEYFSVGASAEVDLVNIASGAGYVSSLFAAFLGNANNWAGSIISIYYDGEITPSVQLPHEHFFLNQYCGINSAMTSEFFGFNRNAADTIGSYMNLPIPYSNGIRITIKNATASAYTLFSTAIIHTGVPNIWSRTRKLLAKGFYVASAAPNSVQTLINESDLPPGRLAAIWLLGDGYPGSASPSSAYLEGNLAIHIDGDTAPAYESSGTEDYFLMSFYFGGAGTNRNGGEVGTTFINASNGTYGAWRTHIRNPVEFESGLKVTWQVGDTSKVPFTGSVRAWATVFYYVE